MSSKRASKLSDIGRLKRPLGLGRDACQVPPRTVVPVEQRRVLRDAVVPDDDGAGLPADADVEVGAEGDVVVEELEQRVGLLLLEALDLTRDLCKNRSQRVLTSPWTVSQVGRSHSHCGLTYIAFSPVAGCVRTIGCELATGSLRLMLPRPSERLTCSMPE